ncbi:hypothetical protein MJD09_05130 [bacterium]|nr:hypothetical protein [bacterium]
MKDAGETYKTETLTIRPRENEPTGSLAFDAAKYRRHVEDFDLTEEQKIELLQALWSIMKAFVDLGFGVDSIQRFIPELAANPSEPGKDAVRSEDNACTQKFEKAVLHTAAKEGDS